MKNQIYQVISVLAIMAYFMPVLIVSLKKLWKATPFMLFALYWAIGGLVNLVDFIPGVTSKTIEQVSVVYNMLDMPIVLAIFYLTTTIPAIKKIVKFALPAYLVLACLNSAFLGLNYDALKYLLAMGLILVLSTLIWQIIAHLQKVQHTSQELALVLVYAALLFQYGTYVIIYVFDYYLMEASNTVDNFIIYYISTIVALIVATCGYLIVGNHKSHKSQNGQKRQRGQHTDSPLSMY